MSSDRAIVDVVDDDNRIREALSALLSSVGYDVMTFSSAAEYLAFERPDVSACLVLDLDLPGMNGLELQKQLVETGSPPIVFLTGHGDIPSTVRAMKAGATEFLSKPFEEEDLLHAIDAAIRIDCKVRLKNAEPNVIKNRDALLTPRGREVLPFVVSDLLNKEAIRDELYRILESSIFVQSDRLGRFLRFTVEKTLAGEGEMLKEYLIGTEVYDRPSSYRPSEDSIVRGEARRLRSKLKEYYESVGKNDPLYIHYRPGSYVPMFRNQHRRVNLTATEAAPRERFTGGDGIRIAVLPFLDASGSASSGVCAQLITDDLIHELVRTDGIRVIAASSVAPLAAKAMNIRSLARKMDVQIVFEGTVCHRNNVLRITSRVVDPADGFQIWSERIETEPDLQDLSIVSEQIASSLVSRIRPTNGFSKAAAQSSSCSADSQFAGRIRPSDRCLRLYPTIGISS
jgi:FixJ family two-component response regulator/TolB-like protein